MEDIVGALSMAASERNLPPTPETIESWKKTVEVIGIGLQHALTMDEKLSQLGVLFEFEIPRRGRPDVVILSKNLALVVEFKVGSEKFERSAQIQVAEYVLDLLDYHSASHDMVITPALIATGANVSSEAADPLRGSLAIRNTAPADLGKLILETFTEDQMLVTGDLEHWSLAPYRPTPGILESAREIFAGNTVADIKHAYADNLDVTVAAIQKSIIRAKQDNLRLLCLVTGVPGSGKTLTGLSAIHSHAGGEFSVLGAYLSGNAPLVEVLRYAIAKDQHSRDKNISLKMAMSQSKTFIQHIRDFFDSEYQNPVAPSENVIVFDEAQRAWDAQQMFRAGKLRILQSQPSLALEIMSKCEDWCVIIAVIGEGQEINRGEAGMEEWFNAIEGKTDWRIVTSGHVNLGVSEAIKNRVDIDESLHLQVGTRAPRAQNLADWADLLLAGEFSKAGELASRIKNFPLKITRDLDVAKRFLHDCASESRRVGMVASSQDRRLRAYGVERSTAFIRSIDWPQWFVEAETDIRSSYALEVAASEFECQGLEIDYTLLCWGSDFLWGKDNWNVRKFKGSKWQSDRQVDFAKNRYRVLLTRARQGMVVWVPSNVENKIPYVDGFQLDKMAHLLRESGFEELPKTEQTDLVESLPIE